MKTKYDKKTDTVYLELGKGKYDTSRKISDAIIVDEDKNGKVLGIEILDASENIKKFNPNKISIQTS